MYDIKKEMSEDLVDGRKNTFLAEKVGCTPQHLSNILNGKNKCSKSIALVLIEIRKNELLDYKSDEEKLEYYFNKIK